MIGGETFAAKRRDPAAELTRGLLAFLQLGLAFIFVLLGI